MSKMVRKQVFITTQQNNRLKARATAEGVPVAEIIRRGIERVLEQAPPPADEGDWKDAWRQACGIWKDRDDLDDLYAGLRKRNKQRMERIRKQMRGR
jgi:hypothetical protein